MLAGILHAQIQGQQINSRMSVARDVSRSPRGTATGQMFGTSKTVMIADIMSAALCMVRARGFPSDALAGLVGASNICPD